MHDKPAVGVNTNAVAGSDEKAENAQPHCEANSTKHRYTALKRRRLTEVIFENDGPSRQTSTVSPSDHVPLLPHVGSSAHPMIGARNGALSVGGMLWPTRR